MSCNSIQQLIALYCEGDLRIAQARTVETHLLSCTACQNFLKDLEASQTMVKELAAEALDPASFDTMRQRVMNEVARAQAARTPKWQVPLSVLVGRHPGWAVGLSLVLALGVLLQWPLWRQPADPDQRGSEAIPFPSSIQKKTSQPMTPSLPDKVAPDAVASPRPEARLTESHRSPARRSLTLVAQSQPEAIPIEPEQPVEQGAVLEAETAAPADIAVEPPPPLVIKLVTDDPAVVIVWLVDQDVSDK